MTTDPTYERARAIREKIILAQRYLLKASDELEEAYRQAQGDYAYNDATLGDVTGALKLIRKALVSEYSVWDGYARARQEALE